jgi:hypothetical protein
MAVIAHQRVNEAKQEHETRARDLEDSTILNDFIGEHLFEQLHPSERLANLLFGTSPYTEPCSPDLRWSETAIQR